MENLKILSLGRNCIKKIENLDGVADTLEELWVSYNLVEKLVGIEKLSNLRVLYLGNNKVRDWSEVDRLSSLDKLDDLLLRGCPLYDDNSSNLASYRIEVRTQSISPHVLCKSRCSMGLNLESSRKRCSILESTKVSCIWYNSWRLCRCCAVCHV